MEPTGVASNIWRYHVYQSTMAAFFFMPVIVLYWRDNGLDPMDVYLLQGLFALANVVLEVPTGMLADRVGKRVSLVAASALLTAGMLVYGLGHGFFVFLGAEVILATGLSLLSGADTALLYDTLKHLDREAEFKRIEGRARALQLCTIAVCSVVGGWVGDASFRMTLWLSAFGPAIALVVALGFVEVRAIPTGDGAMGSSRQLLLDAVRFICRHRLVRWYVGFWAVLSGSAMWLLWLYQPYMELVGLPVWSFGMIFALFNLGAALSSRLAAPFDEVLGRDGTLWALGVLQVAPWVIMAGWISPWSLSCVVGHQAVRGLSRPLLAERILDYTFADKRATVLSLAALCGRLFFAATAALVGWVAKVYPMRPSLLIQGGMLVTVLVGLMALHRTIPSKYFDVKGSVRERQ